MSTNFTIDCVVIDDEPLAVEILEEYISKIPFLNHIKSFTNSIKALAFFEECKPDLVFLDIQMPDLKGTQLASLIQNKNIDIIFTTAYSEYALESYDLNAVDYLLKPIALDRFIKAVNKVKVKHEKNGVSKDEKAEIPTVRDPEYLFVKTDYKIVRVAYKEILYVEGLKDYLILQTPQEKILTLLSFKKILEQLPCTEFVRVHKSYIVPVSKIDSIEKHRIKIGEKIIPIGETYKQEFYKQINYEK